MSTPTSSRLADINDLGFHQRAEINYGAWFQVRDSTPGRFVRDFTINFNQHNRLELRRRRRYLGANINAHWVYQQLGFSTVSITTVRVLPIA
jgi:hypothetical protein